MIIDYGQGDVEIEVSVWALSVYELEFHSDMIQDVFGKTKAEKMQGTDEAEIVFDYSSRNWTAVLKALWACLKAHDNSLPAYPIWAKTQTNLNMYVVWSEMINALLDAFFRPGAAVSE